MSVTACEKYRIVFPEGYATAVTRDVLLFGQLQLQLPLLPILEGTIVEPASQLSDSLARAEEAIASLQGMLPMPATGRGELSTESLTKVANSRQFLLDLVEEIGEFAAVTVHIQNQLVNTNELIAKLNIIRDLDQQVFPSRGLFFSRYYILTPDQLKLFESLLNDDFSLEIVQLNRDDEQVAIIVLGESRDLEIIDLISERYQLTPVEIPTDLVMSTPKQIWQGLRKARQDLLAELTKIQNQLENLARENWHELNLFRDLLQIEQQLHETMGAFLTRSPRSQDLLAYEGWLLPDLLPVLKDRMSKISDEISVQETDEDANPVTILQNPPMIAPFEMVTRLMGVPSSQEIDPSPFLAPFLIAFFGFALGDAGYGLLICLVSLVLLLRARQSGTNRDLLLLLFYGGVSTVVFGVILGGWFGADLQTVPGTIGSTLRSWKGFDLQSSVLFVLVGSLAVGLIQQFLGLGLQMGQYIKNRQYTRAIADSGTWIVLLASIILVLLSGTIAELSWFGENWQVVISVAILSFAIGQGYDAPSLWLRPLMGLAKLFNITSYLSNTLSYARLLALGLATGVIAGVVNLVASTYGNTDSIVGVIVFSLILVLGHGFNLLLSIISVSVNVLRLQLVEFLPRFYAAQGRGLIPHTANIKYAQISPVISGADANFDLIYYST